MAQGIQDLVDHLPEMVSRTMYACHAQAVAVPREPAELMTARSTGLTLVVVGGDWRDLGFAAVRLESGTDRLVGTDGSEEDREVVVLVEKYQSWSQSKP